MDWLRQNLAPDFGHTSPLGRLEGREPYLEAAEQPLDDAPAVA